MFESKIRRNASVELLRCLLMFLIVFHHSAYWGLWRGDGSQHLLLLVGTAAIMWHVDAFVAISGWFGIKFTWTKFFNLWVQVAFYSVLNILWKAGQSHWQLTARDWCVGGGWFTAAYFLLMLISPVLNNAIENIFKKSRQEALLTLKILAIGIALSASPFFLISGVGTGESCTIVLLTFVYVATGIFKRLGVGVNFRALVVAIALYLLVIGVMYTGIVVFFAQDGHYYRVLRIVSISIP